MEDIVARFGEDMLNRLSGPMHIRFILQPTMALLFGLYDGFKDAKLGRAPYLWLLSIDREQRGSLLKAGWRSIAKVFFFALVLDIVYQLITLNTLYPGEALLTSALLALVPYILVRGPANRLAHFIGEYR